MGNHRCLFRVASFFLVAGLVGVDSAGCASSDAAGEAPETPGTKQGRSSAQVGTRMPSIVVKHMDGRRKVDLGSMQGKVVLVDIWASWCAPCMEEMPLLDEMAARLKQKGIEIIAVSVDEDKENAQAFLNSRPKWSLTVAHDPSGKVPEVLRPAKMPSSYLVDSGGIIRYVNEGFERGDLKVIEKRLTALAAESS